MTKKKIEKKIEIIYCPTCGIEVLSDQYYCKKCNTILEDYRSGRIKSERIESRKN